MNRRILFMVNGLGLGNSTRCHAVIRHLEQAGHEIRIITSGNGEWYFRQHGYEDRLHGILPFNYQKDDSGRLSIRKTLAAMPEFYRIGKRNKVVIQHVIDTFKPHAVLTDSVYLFSSLRKKGIRHFALNNSEFIHGFYHSRGDIPSSVRAQFYAIEEMDYFYHRFFPDCVISPSLPAAGKSPAAKFRRVGPIVRPGYHLGGEQPVSGRVVIMLSGSSFGTPVNLNNRSLPFKIDVVGRGAPPEGNNNPQVTYHGKIIHTEALLKQADILVVNGGFSAVSEAFCLQKPTVVVPVPNHAEQWINAKTMSLLGVGEIATEENYLDMMIGMWERLDAYRGRYSHASVTDGAQEAARIMCDAI